MNDLILLILICLIRFSYLFRCFLFFASLNPEENPSRMHCYYPISQIRNGGSGKPSGH